MQSFFIGVGAVVASMLPWLLAQAGVSNVGDTGECACPTPCVIRSRSAPWCCWCAILWTVADARVSIRPTTLHGFRRCHADSRKASSRAAAYRAGVRGLVWAVVGGLGVVLVWRFALDRMLYVLAGGCRGVGRAAAHQQPACAGDGALPTLIRDIDNMPRACASSCRCSSSPGWRCSAMWTQTHAGGDAGALRHHRHHRARSTTKARTGWACCSRPTTASRRWRPWSFPCMVRRFGMQVSHLINLWLGGAACCPSS